MTTREDEMVERLRLAHDYFEEHGLRFHAATVAALSSEREILREALTEARQAIGSLDDDALGMVVVSPRGDDDFGHEYPVRDELLAKIDAALTGVTGG